MLLTPKPLPLTIIVALALSGCTEKKVAAPPPVRAAASKAPASVRSRFYLGIRARTKPVVGEGSAASGVMVRSVAPGSPADAAGLAPGDIIIRLNRRVVRAPADLAAVMDRCEAGQDVPLTVRRGAAERALLIRFVEGGADGLSQGSILAAARFLAGAHKDGAFPHFHDGRPSAAVTALAAWALAEAAAALDPVPAELQAALNAALARLRASIAGDGGIADPARAIAHRCYASACALLALARADPEGSAREIKGLAAYLVERQVDEGEGYDPLDWRYGAFPYYESARSEALRTDISTAAFVARALGAAGLADEHPAWRRLGYWLDETQNFALSSTAEAELAVERPLRDGGFAFSPRNSKAGRDEVGEELFVYRSYGSATADGLRALIALEGSASSERAVAALYWLGRRFDLTKNPGFEEGSAWASGIDFYYLFSLAQALEAADVRAIKLPAGGARDWPDELIRNLALRQGKDGSWRNSSKLMNEQAPVLATSLALLAQAACRRVLLSESGYTLTPPAGAFAGASASRATEQAPRDPLERGLLAYRRLGCGGCHRDGARDRGPSLVGVGDRFLARFDGAAAARSYLRKHLRDPKAFPGTRPWPEATMPAFGEETLPGPVMEDLIAFLLSRRGQAPVSEAARRAPAKARPGEARPSPMSGPGRALYERMGCASCHGPQGHGPELSGLKARYLKARGSEQQARAALRAHIRDPKAVPSLRPARRAGAPMPAYGARALPKARLDELVDYLLSEGR